MNKCRLLGGMAALLALAFTACSSGSDNEPLGEGKLTLSLFPNTSFTRAIDEAAFTDADNYTIDLYQGDDLVWSQTYANLKLAQEIEAGSYRVVAHYGNNPLAALDELYMEGSQEFTVNSGETKTVNLTVTPANAKIAVKTSEDFALYFSDYQIEVLTDRMTAPLAYSKADVETDGKDAYVQADAENGTVVNVTFTLTPKDDVTAATTLDTFTRTVKPQDCLIFTLKPEVTTVAGGTVSGITITIDDSLSTEDVDITLPEDWLN